jgi:hypothetical protein
MILPAGQISTRTIVKKGMLSKYFGRKIKKKIGNEVYASYWDQLYSVYYRKQMFYTSIGVTVEHTASKIWGYLNDACVFLNS